MDDNQQNDHKAPHRKIEDIMRERDRLDKILQKNFRKRMAIVFTDVCGYTKYMDTRGDIAGRAWMQKHNDIVLPLIKQHSGNVLTIMGDGVMSSFEKPALPSNPVLLNTTRPLNLLTSCMSPSVSTRGRY